MTDPVIALVTPQDVRQTASTCRRALRPLAEVDWDARAGDLEWSCRMTLGHMLSAVLYYAVNLTLRSTEPQPSGQADPSLPVAELLDALEGRAALLAAVCAAAPPEARGAHDWGMADATGFAALACDELLVHTGDIAAGLGASFDPPRELCARVLAAYSPGRHLTRTRGRPSAGRTAAVRWGSGRGWPRTGSPTPPPSTSGTAEIRTPRRNGCGHQPRRPR
jgi:uncharacterized protein (TIGR03083 family)